MTRRPVNTRSHLTLAALAAAVALALSACATAAPTASAPPAASQSPVAPVTANDATASPVPSPPPIIEVPAQLQFSASTVVEGAAFEGADLAGKNTVLWFWAPWCPICQAESGTVVEALAELPEDVTLIGVAGGQSDVASMQAFVDKYGVDGFVHVADIDGSIWSGFGITYQPAFAFIGEDGSVRTVPSSMSKADILAGANALVG